MIRKSNFWKHASGGEKFVFTVMSAIIVLTILAAIANTIRKSPMVASRPPIDSLPEVKYADSLMMEMDKKAQIRDSMIIYTLLNVKCARRQDSIQIVYLQHPSKKLERLFNEAQKQKMEYARRAVHFENLLK